MVKSLSQLSWLVSDGSWTCLSALIISGLYIPLSQFASCCKACAHSAYIILMEMCFLFSFVMSMLALNNSLYSQKTGRLLYSQKE